MRLLIKKVYFQKEYLLWRKKYWSPLVDNGFVGKSLGLDRNDYGISGKCFAWFLAPKIKYCLLIDDFGVILAKRTFKGFSEEHRMIKRDEYILLSEGKTLSGSFLIGRTKKFERIRIPHRKQDCADCDDGKTCNDCVIKSKINCFNCDMQRACKTCLDLISHKKIFSTDITMLQGMSIINCFLMMKAYMNIGKIKSNLNLLDKI